ncbi:hypothetical protein NNO_0075 [Hydrogenimonas sp.]|nr:hypothetical protein NNO_0075 [Hydrogenimonas sp.]
MKEAIDEKIENLLPQSSKKVTPVFRQNPEKGDRTEGFYLTYSSWLTATL